MTPVRKALARLKTEYMIEFAWITAKYGVCERKLFLELTSTPKMRAHLAPQRKRFDEIMEGCGRRAAAEQGSN